MLKSKSLGDTLRSIRYWLLGIMWLLLAVGLGYWLKIKEVQHISIAAGRSTSESFELATAIVEEFRKNFPEIVFEVYETRGPRESGILLESGSVDFAMIGANFELGDKDESKNVKSIAKTFSRVSGLLTTPNSNIQNYRDLLGKKVSVPANDREALIQLYGLMLFFEIPPRAYTVVPLSADAADFALQKGEIDAIYRVRNMGAPQFRNLFRRIPNASFIANDVADAVTVLYPSFRSVKVPMSTFKGYPPVPVTEVETAGLDMLLAANKSTPKQLVYKLTKLAFEHRPSLMVHTQYAGTIEPITQSSNILVPLHPGARQYYDREKPSLLQQNSRLLGSLIYLAAFIGSVGVAVRTHIRRSRRIPMQEYNLAILKVLEQNERGVSLANLDHARKDLVGIFKEVVKLLDGDKISSEEFNRFSFTWRAAERTLQRQEASLLRGET